MEQTQIVYLTSCDELLLDKIAHSAGTLMHQVSSSILSDAVVCRAGDPIANEIEEQTGLEVSGTSQIGSSGWSSQMVYSTTDGEKFFVKTSRKSSEQMFVGEAKGLQAMYGMPSLFFVSYLGLEAQLQQHHTQNLQSSYILLPWSSQHRVESPC